jgi:predicted ATP-grasp superfamily ATP-dependent carboligase
MKTALLTLGRLPKALDVAEALSKAGWRVIIAEPAKWHLARVSRYVDKSIALTAPNDHQARYLDELLHVIEEENVSLVVPVSEEALHSTLIESRLPANVKLYSMSQPRLRELHDKARFIKLAKSFGLTVPQTYMLGDFEASQFALNNDYIIKPVCTCSGQGLEIHDAGDDLPFACQLPPAIVQQQMKGALKSTFSMCHEGRVIGSVVYRSAILSGTVGVAFERLDDETAIENWIAQFVEMAGHTGFISFDMMEDENGIPHAIECNPRATSGIHFVERESIAQAITNPQETNKLRLRPHQLMQQFYPCLTETQVSLFKRDEFFNKAKIMLKAKEVNFSWRDPLPLWLMPITSWQIMKRAFINGESFGEASTFDIAWFEEIAAAE